MQVDHGGRRTAATGITNLIHDRPIPCAPEKRPRTEPLDGAVRLERHERVRGELVAQAFDNCGCTSRLSGAYQEACWCADFQVDGIVAGGSSGREMHVLREEVGAVGGVGRGL